VHQRQGLLSNRSPKREPDKEPHDLADARIIARNHDRQRRAA
jgi:hypothetical protein